MNRSSRSSTVSKVLLAALAVLLVAPLLALAAPAQLGGVSPVGAQEVAERGLWVTGGNEHNQLGVGANLPVSYPVEAKQLDGVSGIGDPVDVAFGGHHTLVIPAVQTAGSLLVSGRNDRGQLGNGGYLTRDRFDFLAPDAFDGAELVDVAAGGEHSLAVDDQGRLWAWGSNLDGHAGGGDHVGTGTGEADATTRNVCGFPTAGSHRNTRRGPSFVPRKPLLITLEPACLGTGHGTGWTDFARWRLATGAGSTSTLKVWDSPPPGEQRNT